MKKPQRSWEGKKGTCQTSWVYFAQNMGGENVLDPQRCDKKQRTNHSSSVAKRKMDALELQDQTKNSLWDDPYKGFPATKGKSLVFGLPGNGVDKILTIHMLPAQR